MIALASGVISAALHCRLATSIRSNSLHVTACHTLTSLRLLVANISDDSLERTGERERRGGRERERERERGERGEGG